MGYLCKTRSFSAFVLWMFECFLTCFLKSSDFFSSDGYRDFLIRKTVTVCIFVFFIGVHNYSDISFFKMLIIYNFTGPQQSAFVFTKSLCLSIVHIVFFSVFVQDFFPCGKKKLRKNNDHCSSYPEMLIYQVV